MVSLWVYLLLAAALFSIGAFGVLARRNAIAILMGIELMLNAVNINLVAFWRFVRPPGGAENMFGQVFTVFVFVVAAAEVAVGLAIIISVYRSKRSVIAEEVDLLKW